MQEHDKYRSEPQQRILQLVMLLAGHELIGLPPSQIARSLGCTASQVTRDLANLAIAGLAEKVPDTGYWRLSPQIVQVALRHMRTLQNAEQQLRDVQARFSRS